MIHQGRIRSEKAIIIFFKLLLLIRTIICAYQEKNKKKLSCGTVERAFFIFLFFFLFLNLSFSVVFCFFCVAGCPSKSCEVFFTNLLLTFYLKYNCSFIGEKSQWITYFFKITKPLFSAINNRILNRKNNQRSYILYILSTNFFH